MKLPPSKPTPELDALIEQARHHKMTAAERRQQKISFAYGNLPEESKATREDVERTLDEMEGRDTT